MTPTEFFKTLAIDTRGDIPFEELPFYKWMKAQKPPPDRFVGALKEYFAGHDLKGAFTDEQVTIYRVIYNHFWWVKHDKEDANRRQKADRAYLVP